MTLKLSDFQDYVSDGQEITRRLGHFFVHGSGDVTIGKSERLSILSKMVKKLKPGIDSCRIYTDPGDTETKETLKTNTKIVNKGNQLLFNGSIIELVGLCDRYSDEVSNGIWVSVIFPVTSNQG